MKLYCSSDPHSRIVRIFAAEKGLGLPLQVIVNGSGETRRGPHLERNSFGQVPVLETDEGAFFAESTVICEYLEELHPARPLIGATPAERAECRMWVRRIDLNICVPIHYGFRWTRSASLEFPAVEPAPAAAAAMRATALSNLAWLDQQIAGQAFVCGDRFTLADIVLLVFVERGIATGQIVEGDMPALARWLDEVRSREALQQMPDLASGQQQLSGTV